jgi:hypothetical protein
VCVAISTEYWRSHSRNIISRLGDLVIPASKAKVEPSESIVISFCDFVEDPACDPKARAESDVK